RDGPARVLQAALVIAAFALDDADVAVRAGEIPLEVEPPFDVDQRLIELHRLRRRLERGVKLPGLEQYSGDGQQGGGNPLGVRRGLRIAVGRDARRGGR